MILVWDGVPLGFKKHVFLSLIFHKVAIFSVLFWSNQSVLTHFISVSSSAVHGRGCRCRNSVDLNVGISTFTHLYICVNQWRHKHCWSVPSSVQLFWLQQRNILNPIYKSLQWFVVYPVEKQPTMTTALNPAWPLSYIPFINFVVYIMCGNIIIFPQV